MIQVADIVASGLAGLALGAMYFASLWWTLRKLAGAHRPAVLLFASYLLRLAALVAAFLLICGNTWPRLAACLAGLLSARWIACRWARIGPLAPTRAPSTRGT